MGRHQEMIIDTNVYSNLNRGLKSAIDVISNQSAIYLPVVVLAELRYGNLYGSMNQKNEQQLVKFMSSDLTHVLNISVNTTNIYAELAAYCRRVGRVLSDNDLWIAALSKEHNLKMVTYDRDFEVFTDILSDKLLILED